MQTFTQRIASLIGLVVFLAGNLLAQPGTISTVAGNINGPYGIAVDSAGNVYIAEWKSHQILKMSAGGGLSTIAGLGAAGFGGDGGPAISANLNSPEDVAVDSAGNIYIADSHNNRVREINASGVITTIAGRGSPGYSGEGSATSAQLNNPAGVTVDAAGNVYIADQSNHRIRKVTPGGTISTIAGTGVAGFSGDGGPAVQAQINNPVHLATAAGSLYISDYYNNRVRKVDLNSGVITTIAGSSPGVVGAFQGDGGPATSAMLSTPAGVAVDSAGNIYIADAGNKRIRKINTSGIINTIAGGGTNGDGCLATTSSLEFPLGVALTASGSTFYIADYGANAVRAVALSAISPPNLTAISPSSLVVGTTNSAALSGSGFAVGGAGTSCSPGPTTVVVGGTGVTVSDVSVGGDTSVSLTLTVAAGAALGTRDITLNNSNGTSNTLTFTVVPPTPAPTLSSISPSSGLRGTSVNVTLAGNNFDPKSGGTKVSINGSGISATNINVAATTSMTATFVIDANASTGKYDVTTSTSQGSSNSITFTVNAMPTITSITPATGLRGSNAVVTVSGSNFDTASGGTQLTVGQGITVSSLNIENSNSLTANLVIAPTAALGNYNVSVATNIGTSNAMTFVVTPPGPSFNYGLPQTLNPTEHAPLQLTMTAASPDPVSGQLTFSFTPNAATNMDDPNVTFINTKASTRTVDFTIPANTTTAQFSMSDAVLQAGTVAGMIQLQTAQVKVGGQIVTPSNATFDVTVPRTVPLITNVRILNRTPKGFDVEVTGYSDSKDITKASFEFKATTGGRLQTVELAPDVTTIFGTYYLSSSEPAAGGAFVYTQPFIAQQGNANVVASVTVTLTNAQGASQPKTAP